MFGADELTEGCDVRQLDAVFSGILVVWLIRAQTVC